MRKMISALSSKKITVAMLVTSLFSAAAVGQPSLAPQLLVSEDRFDPRLKLNLSLATPTLPVTPAGQLAEPLSLFVYSNYSGLITRYTLILSLDGHELAREHYTQISPYQALRWQPTLSAEPGWQPQRRYTLTLIAEDAAGRIDRVAPTYLETLPMADATGSSESQALDPSNNDIPGFGLDRTEQRAIVSPADYGKVLIQLQGLTGLSQLTLNGQPLRADSQGYAVYESILPPGEHTFDLRWQDSQGQTHSRQERVSLGREQEFDFFYVAMVDLTWSKNNVTGQGRDTLVSADPDHNDGKGNWDGRVLFYAKGYLNADYRVTAHLDTSETRLKNVFGRLGDRDPRRFTRELDPMEYYPIYGDGSTVQSDVDTEGKLYLNVENGNDHLLWGNYNTGLTGTELANFNRSLYGAEYLHQSEAVTALGETKDYLTVFAANSQTRGSHNEFLSTGGSLYFLKHQRISQGSVKLSVEIRDPNTGRLKQTTVLSLGSDYEVDHFQGRILLSKPLPMTAGQGSDTLIDGGGLLGGDSVWLVADYEYNSDGFTLREQGINGLRAYRWLGDHVRLGTSYVYEEQASAQAYQLFAVDVRWKPSEGTQTTLEFARSLQAGSALYRSDNGGIHFSAVQLDSRQKGVAWKVEQQLAFHTLTEGQLPVVVNGYYSKKERGFSSFTIARERDLNEWGVTVRYDIEPEKRGVIARATSDTEPGYYRKHIESLQLFTALNAQSRLAAELQSRRENNLDANSKTTETLAAVKVAYDLFDGRDTLSLTQQLTLDKQGNVSDNNKTTLGYQSQLTADLHVAAELFASNRGTGGGLGVSYDVNERANLYSKVSNDIDSSAGRGITTVFGGNWKATDQTELYSERQFKYLPKERSTADVYGVKYQPSSRHLFDLSYANGTVNHRNQGTVSLSGERRQTERQVWIGGYGYKGEDLTMRNKLEYRQERGERALHQWVMTNRMKTREYDGLSFLAQFDYARTGGESDILNDFTEAVIGFAYRPITHNQLNLFGKVTYIRGVDPEDQFITQRTSNNNNGRELAANTYAQRSRVYALDGVYEWNAQWQTALKVAHRQGELRYRDELEWFSSGATLYAGRVDYQLNDQWGSQLEYRVLRVSAAQDRKQGWVTSLYHQIGDNARLGVGYNWTDYNDDLTRLNYDSRGWFINIVGSW